MPDTASIILVKRFTYRGQPEEFSNKYHFEGTTPANADAWKTLADGWIAEERKIFPSWVEFVRAYGYEPGSDHANWMHDYDSEAGAPPAGSLVFGASDHILPGDAAATVRWETGEWNSRGKKIYCRKYFHGVANGTGGADSLSAQQKTAMEGYAAVLISGFFPGSAKYSGPQGANLSSPLVSPWITTRTLKRRGKRPLPSGP